MTKPGLNLDWCGHDAAKYACEKWHYSHSLPPPPRACLGVWEGAAFVGCLVFARGANCNMLRPYGITNLQGAELVRVALRAHRAPVSRLLSVAVRLLRRAYPSLRLIVSYADPAHGHHGGIYQAAGWVYAGVTQPDPMYRDASGRLLHRRMVSPLGVKRVFGRSRKVPRPDECRTVRPPGKYRYLYPLDPAMQALVAPLAKPYPKRAAGVAGDTPAVQAGEGGSTPTAALSPDQAPGDA